MFNVPKMRYLLDNTKYSIIQTNGQRIYGLRDNSVRYPPRGSELFVGKLPRSVNEDELVPLFSSTAPIYQLRLMVDFSGRNRGYCFVRYFTREDADYAKSRLDEYEIRRGCHIGVFKSLDNTRLFVGGLPAEITKNDLLEALSEQMDDIKNIIMYSATYDERRNRGYAFLEFGDHRAAAIARRRVPPGSLMLWGYKIKIDWAEPLPEPDPEIMLKVTTLYLRNIPLNLHVDELQMCITKIIDPSTIVNISKCSDFGFLQFSNRHAAVKAIGVLKNAYFYNRKLEVSWALPKMYSKRAQQNNYMSPQHFCLSLPAKHRWYIKKKEQRDLVKYTKGKSSDNDDSFSYNRYFYRGHKKNYVFVASTPKKYYK